MSETDLEKQIASRVAYRALIGRRPIRGVSRKPTTFAKRFAVIGEGIGSKMVR